MYPPPPPSPQFIIVSSLLKVPQLTLFDYKYPDWSITVGYLIGFSSFMWIPIYMVYKLVWTPGSLKQVSVRHEGMSVEQAATLLLPSGSSFSSEVGRLSPAREDHPRNPLRQPPHDHHAMKTPSHACYCCYFSIHTPVVGFFLISFLSEPEGDLSPCWRMGTSQTRHCKDARPGRLDSSITPREIRNTSSLGDHG